MGWEPIDAEYDAQMDAIYSGVLEEYYQSDAYFEDVHRAVNEFTEARQKSFYVEKPEVAEPAFNLLSEAVELFNLGHYGASAVMAGAAAELIFGDGLLKPMVYGLVHNDSVAPMVSSLIENAKAVYKFKALLVAIVAEFSQIDLAAKLPQLQGQSFWSFVDDVRRQRNRVLHGTELLKVTKEEAQTAIWVAKELLETVFPAVLKSIGLHLHGSTVCAVYHPQPREAT